jgi:hypothetical protein
LVKTKRFSKFKLKYDVEYRVLENKSGLWTYKRLQGRAYSRLVVFHSCTEKSYDGYIVSLVIVAGGLQGRSPLSEADFD